MKKKTVRSYRGYKIKVIDNYYCCPDIGEYNYSNRVEIERVIDLRLQLKEDYLKEQGKIEFNG